MVRRNESALLVLQPRKIMHLSDGTSRSTGIWTRMPIHPVGKIRVTVLITTSVIYLHALLNSIRVKTILHIGRLL